MTTPEATIERIKISPLQRIRFGAIGVYAHQLREGTYFWGDYRSDVRRDEAGQKIVHLIENDKATEATTETTVTIRYYDRYTSSFPPYVTATREEVVATEDGEYTLSTGFAADSPSNSLSFKAVVGTLVRAQMLQRHPNPQIPELPQIGPTTPDLPS